MSLNNKIKQQGFTIVELLIVIVVIGILAAITIVAYNGVQNRAKLTTAQAAANNVIKKAELYNTETSAYPTTLGALTTAASTTSYQLTGVTGVFAVPTTAPTASNTVWLYTCGTAAGVKVGYWDYQAGSAVIATTSGVPSAGTVTGTCTVTAS